jgi:hypothetical protein
MDTQYFSLFLYNYSDQTRENLMTGYIEDTGTIRNAYTLVIKLEKPKPKETKVKMFLK